MANLWVALLKSQYRWGRALNVLDLFSGIGGFSLGLERAGMRTVAFCEVDPRACAVLKAHWPDVPIYGDVCALTADRLMADGIVPDVICGGFPCQDASLGQTQWGKRLGVEGERTGLWREFARLAAEFPQAIIILENVPGPLSAGWGRVLGDLAALGRDAEWRLLRGTDFGLPFVGRRIVAVASPSGERWEGCFKYLGSLSCEGKAPAERRHAAIRAGCELEAYLSGLRTDDGFSVTMERGRIHGLGNSIPPAFAQAVGEAIMNQPRMTK